MCADSSERASTAPRVIAVWGPAGSPGRSTLAVELAVELARGGRHIGLIDGDSHAPSLALALGLADEAPGFAARNSRTNRLYSNWGAIVPAGDSRPAVHASTAPPRVRPGSSLAR